MRMVTLQSPPILAKLALQEPNSHTRPHSSRVRPSPSTYKDELYCARQLATAGT